MHCYRDNKGWKLLKQKESPNHRLEPSSLSINKLCQEMPDLFNDDGAHDEVQERGGELEPRARGHDGGE